MRPRSANGDSSGGDIDRMLTEFFRADLPHPWPAPPCPPACGETPKVAAVAPPRRSTRSTARWVLAASVAALALAGAWLAQRTPIPPRGDATIIDYQAAPPGYLLPKK